MYQNRIVLTPSSEIRRAARTTLSGRWKDAVLAMAVYQAILLIPTTVFDMFSEPKYIWGIPAEGSFAGSVYTFVVTGVFSIALAAYFLNMTRGRAVHFVDIFNGFEYMFKSLGLFFMISLFTLLWTFCFIVPGIIAWCRYSQAFYILAENPDKPIMMCIDESKAMMMGNKSKYFCMNLSFIGWCILGSLPGAILESICGILHFPDEVSQIISVVAVIPFLWVFAYMNAADSNFYEIVTGKREYLNPEEYIFN